MAAPAPRRRFALSDRVLLGLGAVFLGVLIIGYLFLSKSAVNPDGSAPGATPPFANAGATSSSTPASATPPLAPPVDTAAMATITKRIEAVFAALNNTAQPLSKEAKAKLVDDLVAMLLQDHSPAAIEAILDFLRGGQDAPTDMPFKVGPGGALEGWPTLRVALMDVLGQVAPLMSADIAREVMAQKTSPDEWAVALRNYAWAFSKDDPYLRTKTREFITNGEWLRTPTTGFLEGFDAVVATKSTDLLPVIATYLDKDAPVGEAVPWAAFLTLDRLALQSPVATLTQLLAQPGLMAGQPQVRASFFARADLRDPGQLALVEQYLAQPNLSDAEATRFGELFPNYSQSVSNTLLSGQTAAQQGFLEQDKATLAVVKQWESAGRFPSPAAQNALKEIEGRLGSYVASGERGAQPQPARMAP